MQEYDEEHEEPVLKEIRFGNRFMRLPAQKIHENRYVYRIDIPPSPIGKWFSFLVPYPIRTWVENLFPEWFLPRTIILKERNPTRPAEFRNEVSIYKRLRHLQGINIPRCFGTAVSDDFDPALVLSYVEGTPLYQLDLEELISPRVLEAHRQRTTLRHLKDEDIPNPKLLSELNDMYDVLTRNGVVHGDPKLHNFIRTKDRVVAIDFEFSCLLPSDVTNAEELRTLIDEIGRTIDVESLEDPAEMEAFWRAHNEMADKRAELWDLQLLEQLSAVESERTQVSHLQSAA
ncbi:hypothetical protein EKO27_g6631 [Xylaria grammica]|uniref:Protein kinase domain-containing protein n=1 Tax=Xylaria grammica TaxID=363999 RepID=A0A439D2H2_9PEZI|nr:hypothetical protein EKO27_g6631 [Xylaria grammica]